MMWLRSPRHRTTVIRIQGGHASPAPSRIRVEPGDIGAPSHAPTAYSARRPGHRHARGLRSRPRQVPMWHPAPGHAGRASRPLVRTVAGIRGAIDAKASQDPSGRIPCGPTRARRNSSCPRVSPLRRRPGVHPPEASGLLAPPPTASRRTAMSPALAVARPRPYTAHARPMGGRIGAVGHPGGKAGGPWCAPWRDHAVTAPGSCGG
jgi:hypothetical protein